MLHEESYLWFIVRAFQVNVAGHKLGVRALVFRRARLVRLKLRGKSTYEFFDMRDNPDVRNFLFFHSLSH